MATSNRESTSTTNKRLLNGDSDSKFRQFIYDFFYVSQIIEDGRREFAKLIGVTPPQYSMLMLIAEHRQGGGITIKDVARILHVQSPFVVLNARILVKRGILYREPNPEDGRSVFLHVTPHGAALIDTVRPLVRLANDLLFKPIDRADFQRLSETFAILAGEGAATIRSIQDARVVLEKGIHKKGSGQLPKASVSK